MSFRPKTLASDVQWYIIAHFLDKPDLLSLATVSRHYNAIAIPVLYARISLLLHVYRLPIQWTPQLDNYDALQDAQRRILETLSARPQLALHVRMLEWQIQPLSKSLPLSELFRDDEPALDDSYLAGYLVKQKAEYHEIFNTLFSLFKNIRKLHFVSSIGGDPPPIPPTLFPHITSVKLTSTSPDIAKVVLHTPDQISELSIDTIWLHDTYIGFLQWLASIPFPALRRLSLRYGPIPDVDDEKGAQELTKLFSTLRNVLLSYHLTLREVMLGFKVGLPGCARGSLRVGASHLESKLVEIIGPVFTRNQWPEVRVLELEGVEPFMLREEFETAVPHLVMSHTRKPIFEIWDPVTAAKF